MVDRVETAALMSKALGRTIEASEMPFEPWAQAAHLPEGPVHEGMKTMYADYDRYGFPGGNALVLLAILGREPRTLRAYIEELASEQEKA